MKRTLGGSIKRTRAGFDVLDFDGTPVEGFPGHSDAAWFAACKRLRELICTPIGGDDANIRHADAAPPADRVVGDVHGLGAPVVVVRESDGAPERG